ncbi:MAG: 4Fe-4S dicluster domain-containing protein [Pseudomonadota bacterium]
MKTWHMIIDIEKCEDCNNCFMACKDEHVDNDFPPYSISQPQHGHRWINIMRKERGSGSLMDVAYRPTPCMHCDDAPCIKAAKDGAVQKREDGIVLIEPVRSKGRKEIQEACPYNAIWWNETKGIPQKCTFCAHLLDGGWKAPRCVQACATGALQVIFTDDAEIQRLIKKESLETLHPEYNTKPRVYYKNLFRFSKCFIAGSIAYRSNGLAECAKKAKVTLMKDGKTIDTRFTDYFGDFKCDNLEEDSGRYMVNIVFQDYKKKMVEVNLMKSINIGNVFLPD